MVTSQATNELVAAFRVISAEGKGAILLNSILSSLLLKLTQIMCFTLVSVTASDRPRLARSTSFSVESIPICSFYVSTPISSFYVVHFVVYLPSLP